MSLENLHLRDFAEQLHTRFRIHLEPSRTVEIELVEVIDRSKSPQHEQFSLIFQGPPQPMLQQRIFDMEHDKMGSLSIFLVPIRGDSSGFSYEAVFSRILKK